MAKAKTFSKKATSPDDNTTQARLSLKEFGVSGLRVSNSEILQEQQVVFRYPHLIKIVEEIRANPVVGAGMNVYRFYMSRKSWCCEAKEWQSDVTKERAKIVETMMHDMEDSWESFIQSVIPYLEYGFDIHEIVPYRRLKRNGSMYNDGLVGIKRLAIRNQDTIIKWNFSEDGRDLVSVEQTISNQENQHRFSNLVNANGNLEIPRNKFLLFTSGSQAGNPQGVSMYKNIFLAHKQMTMLQEQLLLTVAKEAKGLMKIEVPAQYLQGDDSPDKGVAAESFKKIIDGHNKGTNSGLLVPQVIDPESKLPMFNYSLLESKGSPSIDVIKAIQELKKDILVNMSVDVLALGTTGSGSFSLAESKTSILALAIDARLKEIQNVLNKHLMKYIYELNGWDTSEMPCFVYRDNEDIDLADFSSAVQRITAVSAIEMDREFLNKVRTALGLQTKPEDEPINEDLLPSNVTGQSSRSGDGMTVGSSGDGTSKIGGDSSKVDRSIANKENK